MQFFSTEREINIRSNIADQLIISKVFKIESWNLAEYLDLEIKSLGFFEKIV